MTTKKTPSHTVPSYGSQRARKRAARCNRVWLGILVILAFPAMVASAPMAAEMHPSQPASTAAYQLPPLSTSASTVVKGPNDPSDYRALELHNGLQVLLVHDPNADRTAAAMNVDVGSSLDPRDMPGLAHFTEHMLFLGTDHYPGATDYQDWLNEHGGSFNAYTASRSTNYYMDISPALAGDALSRFSRFFIAPRFNADYVNHERHAVDAEYHMGIRDDSRRMFEALGQALNPDHPFTHFSVGNLDTLKKGRKSLHERLIEFHKQHYGAQVMQLAVVGPQSLNTLQQLVETRFAQVPNHGLEKTVTTPPLFKPGQLPEAMQVTSLNQGQQVTFQFPVEDPALHPHSRPDLYLGNMLGDEGRGSLLSALRQQGWATGLNAGVTLADGRHALMSINIDLTAAGSQQLDTIQSSLFAYIQKIRDGVMQKWRFDEQARLLEQQFAYLKPGSGAERASTLSNAMSLLPISEVNSAPYRMDDYDPDVLKRYLGQLTPSNLLRVYQGPEVKGNQTTRWYHVPYTLEHVHEWPRATPLTGLELPSPNPFIAQDFHLEKVADQRPRRILNQAGMALWYQGNDSFGTPSAQWRIGLFSPITSMSPRDRVLTTLLAEWLEDSLDEQLYPALLAGQSSSTHATQRGITLLLSGWRSQQGKVLEAILHQLKQGEISQVEFDRIHQRYVDSLKNRYQQPVYQTLVETMRERLVRPSINSDQSLQQLDGISLDDLRHFRQRWLRKLHVRAMVVGNLSEQEARDTGARIQQKIHPTLPEQVLPDITALHLKANLPTLRPRSDSSDSGALNVHTGPDQQLATRARWALLGQLLKAPFYSQLRTQQQLGYVVTAGYSPIIKAPALLMLVQSSSHQSPYLFQQMDDFMRRTGSQLDALTERQLQNYKNAIISELKQRPQSLGQLTSRQWQQLNRDQLGFDARRQFILAIEKLKIADVKKAWQEFIQSPALRIASDKGSASNAQDYQALDDAAGFSQAD